MQHDICRRLKGSHWSRNFLLGWAWRTIVQSLLTRLAFWKMVKMVSPLTCREGARCWLQWWRTDINMSNFVVVSKQYFTKFRSGQRPPEAKGIAHDDVIYPIYCNCQNCAILGKASKHVRFMSCLSQKTDLSLGGGDGWATSCFSCGDGRKRGWGRAWGTNQKVPPKQMVRSLSFSRGFCWPSPWALDVARARRGFAQK